VINKITLKEIINWAERVIKILKWKFSLLHLKYWLIEKLAGKDMIMLNCYIEGPIKIKKNERGFLKNNIIVLKRKEEIGI